MEDDGVGGRKVLFRSVDAGYLVGARNQRWSRVFVVSSVFHCYDDL